MALAAIVLVMLYAGLDPREFRFRNEISWRGEAPGLVFGTHGIAFTEAVVPAGAVLAADGLTIELALDPAAPEGAEFGFMAVFHDDEARSQLLIGQWRSWIVVMNGDDYDHSRKEPRISVQLEKGGGDAVLLTATSDRSGTSLYLDGRLARHSETLRLSVPVGEKGTRLIVGNSPAGTHPWSGTVAGLALYPRVLAADAVAAHHELWRRDGSFAAFGADLPLLLYPLDEGDGRRASDRSETGAHLHLPPRRSYVAGELLAWGTPSAKLSAPMVWDVVINLLGFVPFGLVTAALCAGRVGRRTAFAAVVLLGAALSFGIEFAQSYLPSRSSSLPDLLLNTAGGALGAAVFLRFGTPSRPDAPNRQRSRSAAGRAPK